nr:hypothetical protein [uncultured Dyadobacter sp.]
MNRKDEHINKYLHGSLPDPEMSADDAWTDMESMLNREPNADAGHQAHADLLSRIWKFVLTFKGALIMIAVTSAFVWLSTVYNSTDYSNRKRRNTPHSVLEKKSLDIASGGPAYKEKATPDTQPSNPVLLSGSPDSIHENKPEETSGRIHRSNVGKADEASPTGGPNGIAILKPALRGRIPAAIPGSAHAPAGIRVNRKNPLSKKSILSGGNQKGGATNLVTYSPRVSSQTYIQPGAIIHNPERSAAGTSRTALSVDSSGISVGHEKTDVSTTPEAALNSLRSIPGHFESNGRDMAGRIKVPANQPLQAPLSQRRRFLSQSIHFGPEWSATGIDPYSPYLFAGADSVNRVARVAIPGFFLNKTWNAHGITFTFLPVQSYFGNNKRIRRQTESIPLGDSLFTEIHYDVNFIKATGMNFSLQYQYKAAGWLSLHTGISYALFSNALIRKETEDGNGRVTQGPLVTVKKSDAMRGYIRPQQWAFKAGVMVHPRIAFNGRIPVGLNVVLPVSNLSKDAAFDVKAMNWQIYLRFLIR